MNVLDYLDGKKTYVGAALMGLAGADQVLHFLSNDLHAALVTFAVAVLAVGVRGALSKLMGQSVEPPRRDAGNGLKLVGGFLVATLAGGLLGSAVQAQSPATAAPAVKAATCPCCPDCPCPCGPSCDCPDCKCCPAGCCQPKSSVTFQLGISAFGRWRPVHHAPPCRPHYNYRFRYRGPVRPKGHAQTNGPQVVLCQLPWRRLMEQNHQGHEQRLRSLEQGIRQQAPAPAPQIHIYNPGPLPAPGIQAPIAPPGIQAPIQPPGIVAPIQPPGIVAPIAPPGIVAPVQPPGVTPPIAGPGIQPGITPPGVQPQAPGTAPAPLAPAPSPTMPKIAGPGVSPPIASPGPTRYSWRTAHRPQTHTALARPLK